MMRLRRMKAMFAKPANFNMSFCATKLGAREVIAAVTKRLRALDLGGVKVDDVQIALAEAVNNVVEHAYVDREPGNVSIQCRLKGNHLEIRICDTGAALPQEKLPPGLAADVSVAKADLPEGGFGWFLIRELTSDIRYDRCGPTNYLSLRFDLEQAEG